MMNTIDKDKFAGQVTERQPQMGLTFEKVWAMYQETDRKFQETDRKFQETDRWLQESYKESEKRMKELERLMSRSDKKISELGNRLGEVVEQLTTPDLHIKLQKLGYTFEKYSRDVTFPDGTGQALCEVDVFLENGEFAMAVEVKAKLNAEHIKEHKERMVKLRGYADAHGDNRKLIGAVAAPLISDSMRRTIQKAGFFAIEPSEESIKIMVPEGFRPKEW